MTLNQGSPEKPAGEQKTCRTCGAPFSNKHPHARFCSPRCRDRHWQVAAARGKQVYDLLLEWRMTRGGRKGVMGDIAHIVDQWIAEDKGT